MTVPSRPGAASVSVLTSDEYATIREELARAVRRICPRWLAADADDIVQAALLRVLTARHGSEGNPVPPASYFWKVAYSAMIDEIRRRRRRNELPFEAQAVDALKYGGVDPEQEASASQIGQKLRACLARLERSRRRAVTLHLQGHSVPDAARLLGWGAKKTENLVYRGLADIRRCLAAAGLK